MKTKIYDELVKTLDLTKLPKHVAIIMDGNGRWAKSHYKPRLFGHQQGAKQIRSVMELTAELKIPYLTLYAFSEENWKRPNDEVSALMRLLHKYLISEIKVFKEKGIRFTTIGNTYKLPQKTYELIKKAIEETKHLNSLTLNLALSYSGRSSLVNATKNIIQDVMSGLISLDNISESTITQYLETSSMPEPDLVIRTSGEHRVSNFLIWESSYSEFVFSTKLWPDFMPEDYIEAIKDFQRRDRRFGGVEITESI